MEQYRAHAKYLYTEDYPCCVKFLAEVELLEALIRQHWSREQAKVFMQFLVDSSWDFYDPYGYISQWTHKAIEHIKQGMTFAELESTGLLTSEGSLFPLDNRTPEQKMHHELMDFDESMQQESKPTFKEQIAAMIRQGHTPTINHN